MPPEWYALPFHGEFTGGVLYSKDQFGRVTVMLNIRSITRVPDNTIVATIPEGFRPGVPMTNVYYDGMKGDLSLAYFNTTGDIKCRGVNGTQGFFDVSVEIAFFPH